MTKDAEGVSDPVVDLSPTPLVKAEIVEQDGLTWFVQGEDVKLPCSRDSLAATLATFNRVHEQTLRKMVVNFGLTTNDAVDEANLRTIVGGCVQHVWYQAVRHQLPPNVIKYHNQRLEAWRKLVKELEELGPEQAAARQEQRAASRERRAANGVNHYELDPKATSTRKITGQAELVHSALKAGPGTLAEIVARVTQTKQLKTRQPVERVVAFYLNQFQHQKLLIVSSSNAVKPEPKLEEAPPEKKKSKTKKGGKR